MGQQVPPIPQLEFHGTFTAGNPIRRPAHTAAKCMDFRVMPGFYLRTRGGRKGRNYLGSNVSVMRIIPYRDPQFPGGTVHPMQIKTGGAVAWNLFQTATYSPFPIETIDISHDSSFALTNQAAGCVLTDRPLLYNGLGVRDNTGSRPPMSTYFLGVTRYFGLDGYAPSAAPTLSFAAGAGNNVINVGLSIYVGLYSSQTGHYSNGVFCGTLGPTAGSGTIHVNNLDRIIAQFHNATEHNELFYVFYATADGLQVPYLILNSSLNGPFTVAVTNTTASLSIVAPSLTSPNGFVLDETSESPFENFPPRPMRSVCYVNGRIYGALLAGGSDPGSSPDFSYVPTTKDLAGVVWSRAAGDSAMARVPGDPNQCWPLINIAYTPSADIPVAVVPAQDNVRILVLTPSSCFLLQEVADGTHEYLTISRNFGCKSAASVVSTPYGIVWVTQHNEIVMLPPYQTQLVYLSRNYQSLMNGNVTAADWIFDPVEQIDRYQVWLDNGTAVIHDFTLGDGQTLGSGEAYSASSLSVTAAATLLDGSGVRFFILANTGIYTHETQPDNSLIPTTDETFTGTGQNKTSAEINGEYQRNWDNFGDTTRRKEFPLLTFTGDGGKSIVLTQSPVTIEWYGDFEQVVDANKHSTSIQKGSQSLTDQDYLVKLNKFHQFWYKLVFKLAGHSTDDASFANHVPIAQQGDLALNFYGCILEAGFTLASAENRA